MRGCITLVMLFGGAMVAITSLGLWFFVLLVGVVVYLALMIIGKACVWVGESMKGDEIGEWKEYDRVDQ